MGIVAIIALVIFFLLVYLTVTGVKKGNEAKDNYYNELEAQGFVINKTLSNGTNALLLVDDSNKKWTVRLNGFQTTPVIYNFSDLLEFEVYEDGDSIAKGRTGSAIVGGLLLGTVGAVAGTARKKKIKNTCTQLQVRITVNNLNSPEIVIPFITSETEKSSLNYQSSFTLAKQFATTLAYIENGN